MCGKLIPFRHYLYHCTSHMDQSCVCVRVRVSVVRVHFTHSNTHKGTKCTSVNSRLTHEIPRAFTGDRCNRSAARTPKRVQSGAIFHLGWSVCVYVRGAKNGRHQEFKPRRFISSPSCSLTYNTCSEYNLMNNKNNTRHKLLPFKEIVNV